MLIWGTKVQCFTRTKKWAYRFSNWRGLNKNLPLVGFVALRAVNVVAAKIPPLPLPRGEFTCLSQQPKASSQFRYLTF